MALQYFCQIRGKEYGPMTGSELSALAKMGKLSAIDMVRPENSDRWLPAERFQNLKFGTISTKQKEIEVQEKEEIQEAEEVLEEIQEVEEVQKKANGKGTKLNQKKIQTANLGDIWGHTSLTFCIISGGIAIGSGVNLVMLKAVGENSMIEAIAHGMGFYFMGKGLFMMSIPFQARGAIERLFSK